MKIDRQSRRLIAAVGVIAVSVALVVAGCSSGKDSGGSGSSTAGSTKKTGKLTIAYLQKQADQQYFQDEIEGAKKAAAADGNVNVTTVDLAKDANKAITALDSSIAQKVDGIIIVVPDQKIGPQIIDAARKATIPLMASDDNIKDSAGADAPFAGFDGTAMGNKVGEEAARLYTKSGWTAADTVILSGYQADLSVAVDRVKGAANSFKKAVPNAPKIVDVQSDGSVTDAQNKAGAVITANPGVKNWVVWGFNDETETGIVTALQNQGVSPDNINGVGLGAYLTCKDWKSGAKSGNKSALFISGVEVGKTAVSSMIALLRNGTTLPPKSIANTAIVDASNYEAAGVKCT